MDLKSRIEKILSEILTDKYNRKVEVRFTKVSSHEVVSTSN